MSPGNKVWYFNLDTFEVKEGILKEDNYPYNSIMEDGNEANYDWVFDNPDDLQNALRNYRNDNQVITNKLQHAIDELSLKKYNCDDLIGKYFVYNDDKLYIYVKSIERLYRGPRLTCAAIWIYNEGFVEAMPNYSLDINWEDVEKLKEISEQDFITALNKQYNSFIESYANE